MRYWLCCACWFSGVAMASGQDLQALIDAAPSGSTLRLAAGTYRGPVRIARPLTIEGGGRAEIRGNGQAWWP
jgi:nitrous oxidase accessory protein